MPVNMALQCPNCYMLFNSTALLNKHRSRFCVGASTERSQDNRQTHGDDPNTTKLQSRPQVISPARSSVLSTNSSVSIALPSSSDEDEPTYHNPERENRQRKLRMEADAYGQNLAQYKSRSKSLEAQREEIERRLRQVEHLPPTQPLGGTTFDIQHLREKDAKNQRALNDLRYQLQDMSGRIPFAGDKFSLQAEINALRQLYLGQGGSHAGILAQLAELEGEARGMQESEKLSARKTNKGNKFDTLNERLLAFEMENQHLQTDLLDIQERNNRLLTNRAVGKVDDGETEKLNRKQEQYRIRLEEMEQEIEHLRHQAKLASLRREVENQPLPQPTYRVMPDLEMPQPQSNPADTDPLTSTLYDKNVGFMVFYDFIMGLDPSLQAIRLVVSLYNNVAQYGEPSILPTVYCDNSMSAYDPQHGVVHNTAIVNAKQPVPRCPPSPDLGLVVELQVAGPGGRLSTRGWCRLDLFDDASRLISGRWCVPFRMLPIRPNASVAELSSMPQYGSAQLFLRLVNHRDSEAQSLANVNPQNAPRYQHPPQAHSSYPRQYVPPPPSVTPPDTPDTYSPAPRHRPKKREKADRAQFGAESEAFNIGFQIDRVKHAEPGEGKVRVTAYYQTSGRAVQSDDTPVTASTTAVKSNFKYQYHVFGQQEALFSNVRLRHDVILVIRFYLRRKLEQGFDNVVTGPQQESGGYDDETLVAWGVIPLLLPRSRTVGKERSVDLSDYRLNVGTHRVTLYHAPVPESESIPLDGPKSWQKYHNASVRLNVFVDKPRPGSLTPSEESDPEDDTCPEFAWIEHERDHAPSDPYTATDGFDIYIDGCRYLPDCVTFTRVAGRILSRKYEKVGRDINTSVRLDSDIYNPVYDYRSEIREPNLPPSATLLFKVYTIDRFSKKITVAGYATLNIFVETGTERQPASDTAGIQVCLNEGGHQLRLYQLGPNGIDPLTATCLVDGRVRHVPCATLLVRIYKAAIGPQGRPLEAEKVPQADWARMGIFRQRPSYADQVYLSTACKPTKGECQLFHAQNKRPKVSLRECLHNVLEPAELKKIKTDKQIEQYIRSQLTRLMDVIPMDIDLTYVAQYKPKIGIQFAIDAAMNLPWSNFTHANYCLNPPGAFYQGQPYAAYDKLVFTSRINADSTNRAPVWKNGFTWFPNRAYHQHLVMIVHLQEIQVIVSADSYKYGLLDQAWTAIPIFSEGYATTNAIQAPLFQGSPSTYALKQLSQQPIKTWITHGVTSGNLSLLKGASVFVRVADGRREEEVLAETDEDGQVNRDLLPEDLLDDYRREEEGRVLSKMVPQGKNTQEFFQGLATKFKSLVYKLYEEGNVNAK